MPRQHTDIVAEELGVRPSQVAATASLLADGATVPFIARYRKEATGSLDEVAIAAIRDRLEQLESLNKRRTAIIESLAERELLTDDLSARIAGAATLAELEDTYLPFRPKRRTRAMVARERGLGPLADLLPGPEDISLDRWPPPRASLRPRGVLRLPRTPSPGRETSSPSAWRRMRIRAPSYASSTHPGASSPQRL